MVVLGGSTFNAKNSGKSGDGSGIYRGLNFQELDQLELCRPYCKYVARPTSISEVGSVMSAAFQAAISGVPGPSYVDLTDVLITMRVEQRLIDYSGLGPESYSNSNQNANKAHETLCKEVREQVDKIASLLSSTNYDIKPLLIVGKGAAVSRTETPLKQLVKLAQLPFLPTPMGKGVIPDIGTDNGCSTGGVTDYGSKNASAARSFVLQQANVVLVVGARLNWILHGGRRFANDAKVYVFDAVSGNSGDGDEETNVEYVVGDLKDTIGMLLASIISKQQKTKGAKAISQDNSIAGQNESGELDNQLKLSWNQEYLQEIEVISSKNKSKAGARLAQKITYSNNDGDERQQRVVMVTEGANTMDIGRTVFDFVEPRTRLDAGTFGTMGVGFGYMIASYLYYHYQNLGNDSSLAKNQKILLGIFGDSAFGFSAVEIETAARYRIPFVAIVINNSGIYFGHDDDEDDADSKEKQENHHQQKIDHVPLLPPTSLSDSLRYDLFAESLGHSSLLSTNPNGAARDSKRVKGYFVASQNDLQLALEESFRGVEKFYANANTSTVAKTQIQDPFIFVINCIIEKNPAPVDGKKSKKVLEFNWMKK
ncbi:2-hydroxyacyl-CoA lyase 1 [Zancudomyces culisetae]|uniref:2-hydroxyacyl-CoA lyase n=1 Tax=Zancudomyces culisetae TaxID=1213189 RepID=A0A1R1PS90_ZANCU|nr:2-hydroxyacyl-CoA lyase 1 [Zancudomyces culisetae]|eukprot:OMH83850.1 2-hydroxyacyl-CoA lyase 1 [Zancudomyces culisetae]